MLRSRLALVVLTVVALSGCGATPTEGVADPDAIETASGDPSVFLEQVRTTWAGSVPGDEVLLRYGRDACAQLEAGEAHNSVQIVDASAQSLEVTDANTRSIVDAAALSLCPAASVD